MTAREAAGGQGGREGVGARAGAHDGIDPLVAVRAAARLVAVVAAVGRAVAPIEGAAARAPLPRGPEVDHRRAPAAGR